MTGTSPSRARPSRNPRRRIARSSSGSRPSWSRNVDHACACTRSSSAVQRTGAPSPAPVASATSARSAAANAAGSATRRGAIEFADDRARGIRPEVARGERRRDERERGLDRLAGEPDARPGGRPERDAPARLERRDLRHPLDELGGRAATPCASTGAGRPARRATARRPRPRTPRGAHRPAGRAPRARPSRRAARRRTSRDASSNGSTSASAERSCSSASRDAGHGSILVGPTDIRIASKNADQPVNNCSRNRALWRTSADPTSDRRQPPAVGQQPCLPCRQNHRSIAGQRRPARAQR